MHTQHATLSQPVNGFRGKTLAFIEKKKKEK